MSGSLGVWFSTPNPLSYRLTPTPLRLSLSKPISDLAVYLPPCRLRAS